MKIEWKGGECPVSGDTNVRIWFRDGTQHHCQPAGDYLWSNDGDDGDIIAYEVIEEAKEDNPEKTLRDEFAMAALTGILSKQSSTGGAVVIATMAYYMADEMMEARAK